ncbi:MAG: hypothetical protein KGZ83_02645 [Sulfuricella sp.]|nr:hypothetical protein [Sulfuricella sp.]
MKTRYRDISAYLTKSAGRRIQNMMLKGQPFHPNKTYKVAGWVPPPAFELVKVSGYNSPQKPLEFSE